MTVKELRSQIQSVGGADTSTIHYSLFIIHYKKSFPYEPTPETAFKKMFEKPLRKTKHMCYDK